MSGNGGLGVHTLLVWHRSACLRASLLSLFSYPTSIHPMSSMPIQHLVHDSKRPFLPPSHARPAFPQTWLSRWRRLVFRYISAGICRNTFIPSGNHTELGGKRKMESQFPPSIFRQCPLIWRKESSRSWFVGDEASYFAQMFSKAPVCFKRLIGGGMPHSGMGLQCF